MSQKQAAQAAPHSKAPSRAPKAAPAPSRPNKDAPRRFDGLALLPRLELGAVSAPAEREADELAQAALLRPNPLAAQALGTQASSAARPADNDKLLARLKPAVGLAQGGEPLGPELENQLQGARRGGQQLENGVREEFEARFGHDFKGVRIHTDARAAELARELRAHAFTLGSHIFFADGQYQPNAFSGRQLLAHELAHVVQHAPDSARRAPAGAAKAPPASGPPIGSKKPLELMNMTTFDPGEHASSLELNKATPMSVKFGDMAAGTIKIKKTKDSFQFKNQAIPFQRHPLLHSCQTLFPNQQLGIIFSIGKDNKLEGYIASYMPNATSFPKPDALFNSLKNAPGLIGFAPFWLGALNDIENNLNSGQLKFRIEALPFKFGSVLSGTIGLGITNNERTLKANADLTVPGLSKGSMELKYNDKDQVTGKLSLGLTLCKSISGSLEASWDGEKLNGTGEVGYQGEKFNGKFKIFLLDKATAEKLAAEKKPASQLSDQELGETPPAPSKETKAKPSEIEYVLSGDGELEYVFNEWLSGRAQVIVDYKGDLTVIGEIKAKSEIELFPQKDFEKSLFNVKAEASYGIPVVGNIFLYASIGLSAFAIVGPGTFKDIVVRGNYSTDPYAENNFEIEGALNISASAGIKMRAEGGAGIEILAHDIKVGVGLTGIAGIKGYAEARPLLGYREKAQEGEDKKGEFFILGDFEIAAEPFLGLSGDLFVEIDAPWPSPISDDRWTWPLFNKEWPLGGNFGIGATIEHVFGSNKTPEIEFKPVEFDSSKFMSDMIDDKAGSGKGNREGKGRWGEKNTKKAEPPPKPSPQPDPPKPKAPDNKPKSAQGGKASGGNSKKTKGKSLDKESNEKAMRKAASEPKKKKTMKPPKGAKSSGKPIAKDDQKAREENKYRAGEVVRKAMTKGIHKKDLQKLLKKLKSDYKLKRAELEGDDDVILQNSPTVEIKGERIVVNDESDGVYHGRELSNDPANNPNVGLGSYDAKYESNVPTYRKPLVDFYEKQFGKPNLPHPLSVVPDEVHRPLEMNATLTKMVDIKNSLRVSSSTFMTGMMGNFESSVLGKEANYNGGHLLGFQFGGKETEDNLVPMQGNEVNRGLFALVENFVKDNLSKISLRPQGASVIFKITCTYGAGIKLTYKNIAEGLKNISGKEVNFDNNSSSTNEYLSNYMKRYFTDGKIHKNLLKKLNNQPLNLNLSNNSVVYHRKEKKLWTVTDRDNKIVQIRLNMQNKERTRFLVSIANKDLSDIYFESSEYLKNGSTSGDKTEADKTVGIIPKRIPKNIKADITLENFTEFKQKKDKKDEQVKGDNEITIGNPKIQIEGSVKEKTFKSKNETNEFLNKPENKGKKLTIKQSFTIKS